MILVFADYYCECDFYSCCLSRVGGVFVVG